MMSRRPLVQRILIGLFAVAACAALGVRSRTTQASPWVKSEFKGPARAALKVHDSVRPGVDPAPPAFDVYASTVYGTEVSSFSHGLFLKTSFPVPRTEDKAVLIVDIDRSGSRTRWEGADGAHLRARYYLVSAETGQVYFDADSTAADLVLEKIAIAAQSIGFRMRGTIELTDPGDDRLLDTEDDGVTEVELVFETIPPPEAIAAGIPEPSPLPPVYCEWPDCYEDPGYYYDPYDAYYDPSCGNTSVGYSYYDYDDGTGCDGGDTVVDSDDPSGEGDDDWDADTSDGCSSESDDSSYYDDSSGDGCEGSSDSSSSSDGCSDSSSSSSSGCSDSSSSSSGCGGSGCEGDTFDEQAPPHETKTLRLDGLLGWGPMLLLFGLVLAIHRRRP